MKTRNHLHTQPRQSKRGAVAVACIAAASMMLDVLGEKEYASDIEDSIIKTAQNLDSLSAGKMGMGTSEVGDMVKDFILTNGE